MSWIILAIVLGSTAWVAYDARRRDWKESQFVTRTWVWVAGTFLLWIAFFPLYLYQRTRVPSKA